MDSELDELTDVCLRHHATNRDEDFWAFAEVERRVRADLAQAWAVVQILVEKADAGTPLGYISAGPLEDLVDGYGDSALDVIETACETNEKMQLALSGIWLERKPCIDEVARPHEKIRVYGRHPGAAIDASGLLVLSEASPFLCTKYMFVTPAKRDSR
jgi:hypothetical protein